MWEPRRYRIIITYLVASWMARWNRWGVLTSSVHHWRCSTPFPCMPEEARRGSRILKRAEPGGRVLEGGRYLNWSSIQTAGCVCENPWTELNECLSSHPTGHVTTRKLEINTQRCVSLHALWFLTEKGIGMWAGVRSLKSCGWVMASVNMDVTAF